MKRKTIIAGIGLIALFLIGACTAQTNQNVHNRMMAGQQVDNQAMIEHCKMMPQMRGCEQYIDQNEQNTVDDARLFMMGNPQGYYLPQKANRQASQSKIIDVKEGDVVYLSADIVNKNINGVDVTMFSYNGEIPGPILRGKKGTSFTVEFTNHIDWNTTVHWHGLRHDNKDDGVPGVTQDAVKPNEKYTYTVRLPDEGMYWYHPHVREDMQQDLGLAGNLWVIPNDENYFNEVNREEVLMLDDILMDEQGVYPYGKDHGTFSLMGRYGNVMLINGGTDYELHVKRGEVIRFYVTNVANVRPFNLSFSKAKIKLIGSDLGKYEHEEFVDSVIIGPAERYIVEVYFEEEGEHQIMNINPLKKYTMGKVVVSKETAEANYSSIFNELGDNKEISDGIDPYRQYFNKKPDYDIALVIDMMGMRGMGMMRHGDEKIEWEDTMTMMNVQSNSALTKWVMKDRKSGKENMDFMMHAHKGDVIKIRLFNDPKSMHPMQHPMHLHGQRFLVLNVDGVPNGNFVWKDTVMVPIGSTVDILVDVTNPGEWMMHCHIAEHLEAGMMSSFVVE